MLPALWALVVVLNVWSKNKIRQVNGVLHIMLNVVTAYLCILIYGGSSIHLVLKCILLYFSAKLLSFGIFNPLCGWPMLLLV